MADYPATPWAEQALNELATHLVTQDQDDEADTVFRQLMRAYPKSPYAERAAWKVGWRAYRRGDFQETIEIFEAAASNFPRGDTRPAWLYWAGRARERLNDTATANARFRLVVVDYQNSYYGRLASGILKAKKETPVLARIGARDAGGVDRRGRADGRNHPGTGRRRSVPRRAARGGVRAERCTATRRGSRPLRRGSAISRASR